MHVWEPTSRSAEQAARPAGRLLVEAAGLLPLLWAYVRILRFFWLGA